ncbi:hypothetical protein [Anaerovibrio slackiae]
MRASWAFFVGWSRGWRKLGEMLVLMIWDGDRKGAYLRVGDDG